MTTPADLMESIEGTLQHIELVAHKEQKLTRARLEAESQLLHRVAIALDADEIHLFDLVHIAAAFRASCGEGGWARWNAAISVSMGKLQHAHRNLPNGPHCTWTGEWPLATEDSRPAHGQSLVYVLYDADLRPCYVGSTSQFLTRMKAHHKAGKRWSFWTAHPCLDREDAYELEDRLLREHRPYLNVRASR